MRLPIRKNIIIPVLCLGIIAMVWIVIYSHSGEEAEPPVVAIEESANDTVNREYSNTDLSINERVEILLSQMTLEEKIGQMVQAERGATNPKDISRYYIGSVLSGGGSAPSPNTPEAWMDLFDGYQHEAMNTRLQIPILYGIDAVHGHNNVYGATIFPHNIGLGATRDPDLIQRIGTATAIEVRATGLNWTFAPCLTIPLDERWGRTYEGYGEDPQLVAQLGAAMVIGLQGDRNSTTFLQGNNIVGTAKHWIGDGATKGGMDRGNIEMTEEELTKYMLPYEQAIQAGVRSVMISFSGWNGVETHGDKYLITQKLKGELGFDGIVISDWDGINQISNHYETAIRTSVNAGIDMFMVPNTWKEFISILNELAQNGEVPISRIDDAVSRILRVKFEAGLFEQPYTDRQRLQDTVLGSKEHREIAREAVQQSLVLLKNENDILPLAKSDKIFVAGKHADDIGLQSGGWTITWQGGEGNITTGTTILDGIQEVAGSHAAITYDRNGHGAQGHDVAIVVVGEQPYAEMEGDQQELSLSSEDRQLLATVKEAGIPVVVILLSGRPLIITDELGQADAFVAAWLPGSEGAGVADVLFGDTPFSGKLPVSWPRSMEQIPINTGDDPYHPLFPYGFGLTTP